MKPLTRDFSVLVVQPDEEGPVERFGPWLTEQGAVLHTVRPYLGEHVPNRVNADALLVMGGDMGANDDAQHPWLADVRSLMASAVAEEVPTLGICLGAQILAAATGGTVDRGSAGMECGVVEIRPRPEACEDIVMRHLPWPLLQGCMHRDAITVLPPGATWLAESQDYRHQAFRLGGHAWGVQFHPEVSPTGYRRWVMSAREDESTTERLKAGIAQFDRLDDQVRSGAHGLAVAFASVVQRRASDVREVPSRGALGKPGGLRGPPIERPADAGMGALVLRPGWRDAGQSPGG